MYANTYFPDTYFPEYFPAATEGGPPPDPDPDTTAYAVQKQKTTAASKRYGRV